MTTQETNLLPEDVCRRLREGAYQGHYGGCPICGHSEGPIKVVKEDWFICRDHRIRWCVGVGLFDVLDEEWNAWKEIDEFLSYFREIGACETVIMNEEADGHER